MNNKWYHHNIDKCEICQLQDKNFRFNPVSLIVETIHRIGTIASVEDISQFITNNWEAERITPEYVSKLIAEHENRFVKVGSQHFSVTPESFYKASEHKRMIHKIYRLCKTPQTIADIHRETNVSQGTFENIIRRLPQLFEQKGNRYISIPLAKEKPVEVNMNLSLEEEFRKLQTQKITELKELEKNLLAKLSSVREELKSVESVVISTAKSTKPPRSKVSLVSQVISIINESGSKMLGPDIQERLTKRGVTFDSKRFLTRTLPQNLMKDSDGFYLPIQKNPFEKK